MQTSRIRDLPPRVLCNIKVSAASPLTSITIYFAISSSFVWIKLMAHPLMLVLCYYNENLEQIQPCMHEYNQMLKLLLWWNDCNFFIRSFGSFQLSSALEFSEHQIQTQLFFITTPCFDLMVGIFLSDLWLDPSRKDRLLWNINYIFLLRIFVLHHRLMKHRTEVCTSHDLQSYQTRLI